MTETTENIFERIKEKKLISLTPRKALNKAFLKVKPTRNEIESFKTNLITLLDSTNNTESEEFHKNLVIDFLKKTYYDPSHFVNTKGRNDLVIHNGQNANSAVGVIIEAKKPNNKDKMITTQNLNKDAFYKLVLYYLRERITHKNLKVKHLIATNINEWFIFDEYLFERLFAQNKSFVREFEDFEASKKKTEVFYKDIAEPFINTITDEIEFTYFNIQEYQKPLRNNDKEDDNLLITLFKIFSPEHLLKLPFANDSNSLDKGFYSELLHIIGLTETKEGNKKLIERNKVDERNTGTILESVIVQLDSLDKLSEIQNINQFGNTIDEQLFNIAIELTITWINRILFLKLLEAQLLTYHKGDKSYLFFNLDKIKNYDDLNSLFFQVLAKKYEERNPDVKKIFEKIPYLNSSLFELTELENKTLVISNLQYNKTIPIFAQTVIKDRQGKKRAGNLNTLEYLFEFLNAYDFGAEGSEEIQEENKTLINASVLGLIFEKINGYKDGSFFTPGFITMYMCRETIRKAIIQKFDYDFPDYKINKIENIYELIPQKISRQKANEIINSIKFCPAVGSGHFLVSALNELIAIKNDLKILEDKEGKSLHRYEIEIINDELTVIDEEGKLFKYNPNNKESQRIQETLFHEKQTIIENCLFGVDINPNSVKICQLRLWIELLKNAYYKEVPPNPLNSGNYIQFRELETLPNIDINIKCGNSLISRFDLHEKYNINSEKEKIIDEYKSIVAKYKNSLSLVDKNQIRERIKNIKNTFIEEFNANSLWVKKLNRREVELTKRERQIIEEETKIKLLGKDFEVEANKNIKNLKANIQIINQEIKEIKLEIEKEKNQEIYKNSFEWRFEFPEVLDESGNFIGFDVVIGNPPYTGEKGHKEVFRIIRLGNLENFYQRKMDIFYFFFHLGLQLLKVNGKLSFITTNYYLTSDGGENLRTDFKNSATVNGLINLNELRIFESAKGQHNLITFLTKGINAPSLSHNLVTSETGDCNQELFDKVISVQNENSKIYTVPQSELYETTNNYIRLQGLGNKDNSIFNRIIEQGTPLIEICDISQGILSGVDRISNKHIESKLTEKENINQGVYVLTNDEVKNKKLSKQELELIRPWFKNSDIHKYWTSDDSKYKVIYATRDLEIKDYPTIKKHFEKFEAVIKNRSQERGEMQAAVKLGKWWVIFAARTKSVFEGEKIICPQRTKTNIFGYNTDIWYSSADVYYITNAKKGTILKYILALLNSKLYFFWLYNKGKRKGENLELYYTPLTEIPVKKINLTEQQPFIDLVEKILSVKKQNPTVDTTELEEKIDKLVYELYSLTEEEIKIIEESSK